MAKSVILPIVSTIDNRGIQSAIGQLNSLGNSMKNVGRAIAGSLIVNKVGQFMADSTVQARDYERNIAALATVFDEFTPQMQKFVDSSVSFGQSQTDAAKSATFLGSVLKQAGLPMQQVANQTESLVRLATDLATTYGYDVSEALTGMTALFRGEYDPIEKFGVAMKQSEVNAVLAANGQSKLQGAARRNAEQLARLALLYDRTTDAQGAFQRQGDSLFVQQAKLNATFKNFEIAVGQNLIPVLAEVAAKIAPVFEKLLPSVGALFAKMGDVILAFANALIPAAGESTGLIDALTMLLTILERNAQVIVSSIAPLLTLAITYKTVSAGAGLLTGAQKVLEGAGVSFGASLVPLIGKLKGWAAAIALVVAGIAILTDVMMKNQDALDKYDSNAPVPGGVRRAAQLAYDATYSRIVRANPESSGAITLAQVEAAKAYKRVVDQYLDKKKVKTGTEDITDQFRKMLDDLLKNFNDFKVDPTGGATKVVSWFDKLAEEVRKQQYAKKLEGLGLSDALIKSIIGSGETWKTTADTIIKKGREYATTLQNQFKKTADGLAEIAAAAEEAAKKAQQSKEFIKDVLSAFADVNLLKIGARAIGEYESSVVSLFDTIKSSLKQGLEDKALNEQAFTFVSDYASKQYNLLVQKARAIDVITKKIEIARSTTASILSGTSITSALNTETKSVTESFKQMRNGIEITITRTIDAVKNNDLVASYRALVEKTKTFAKNLASLKALGINPMLFKQILEAGADAGGAVAQAIVDGGATTVGELNGLFGELDSAASSIAEGSTDLLYNLGEDVTNSFISGLLAQKVALVAAAQSLVDSVNTTLKKILPVAVAPDFKPPTGEDPVKKLMEDLAVPKAKIDLGQEEYGKFIDTVNKDLKAIEDPASAFARFTVGDLIPKAPTVPYFSPNVSADNAMAYANFRRSEMAGVTVNVNANVVRSDSELGLIVYDAIQAAQRAGIVSKVL